MKGNLPELWSLRENVCVGRRLRCAAVFAALAVTLPAAPAPRQPNRRSAGTVYAWGDNSQSQLGNGANTNSPTLGMPGPVSNLNGVVAFAAGEFHSLAFTNDGKVWAWGRNDSGQLGTGVNSVGSSVPVQVINTPTTMYPSTVLSGVIAVAAGDFHSLALKSDGTVWAWGSNAGVLGNGLGPVGQADSYVPVQVYGTSSGSSDCPVGGAGETGSDPNSVKALAGVVAIAAGGFHSLALTSDGKVWAWGSNNGDLGNNSVMACSVAVRVLASSGDAPLTNIVAIAAGHDHSLAVTSDGNVWSWGSNNNGELGDSTTTKRTAPMMVSAFSGVVSVAGGDGHSLALKGDGTVWAWGRNVFGQLGNGSTSPSGISLPVQVQDTKDASSHLTGVVAIAAGFEHSLALKGDGKVWAWGFNNSGELGNSSTTDAKLPGPVSNLGGVVAIAGGATHTLALQAQTTGDAWGSNSLGQLGNDSTTDTNRPVIVSGLSNVVSISGGDDHSLALTSLGQVWAWGDNGQGELGNGTPAMDYLDDKNPTPPYSKTPLQVNTFACVEASNCVVAISAGGAHNLALTSEGQVWAWGTNDDGELGYPTPLIDVDIPLVSTTPMPVRDVNGQAPLSGVIAIAAGIFHSLALTSGGTVLAWGYGDGGDLGDGLGEDSNIPVQVGGSLSPLSDVIAIAVGGYSSLALKSDGTVWAWGDNSAGQLGDSTSFTNSNTPKQVSNLTNVVAIAAGTYHSLALKSDGTVWAWGDNSYGELGYPTQRNQLGIPASNTPKQVGNLPAVVAIAAGGDSVAGWSSLALTDNGEVRAWGDNAKGELGNGSATPSMSGVPLPVANLNGSGNFNGVVSIAGGGLDSLATALPIVDVTINSTINTTLPAAFSFTSSGPGCQTTTYATPATLVLAQGAVCQIMFTKQQFTKYFFSDWTDGGANPRPLTAPTMAAAYTANFTGGTIPAQLPPDMGTQGNWYPMYGNEGYYIAKGGFKNPTYATVTFGVATPYTWQDPSAFGQALFKTMPTTAIPDPGRIASTYTARDSFDIGLTLTGGSPHQVMLYLLDFDTSERVETISLLDHSNGDAPIYQTSVSSFHFGQYLGWNLIPDIDPETKMPRLSQDWIIRVSRTAGLNAVVSGLFFDKAPPKSPPTVAITAPAAGPVPSPLTETMTTVTAHVQSSATIGSVQFLLDGANLLGSSPVTSDSNGNYSVTWNSCSALNGTQHTLAATATDSAGNLTTSDPVSVKITRPMNSACFVGMDTKTQGYWIGVYGGSGEIIATGDLNGDTANPPFGDRPKVVFASASEPPPPGREPADARGLLLPGTTTHTEGIFSSDSTFKIDVNFEPDTLTHQVALYLLDWEQPANNGRTETITFLNGDDNSKMLDIPRPAANFHDYGTYMIWNVTGHVTIQVTNTNTMVTQNGAVVSGLFFDPGR